MGESLKNSLKRLCGGIATALAKNNNIGQTKQNLQEPQEIVLTVRSKFCGVGQAFWHWIFQKAKKLAVCAVVVVIFSIKNYL